MQVKFLDLSYQNNIIKNDFIYDVTNFINNGNYILEHNLREFEVAFAKYCDSKYSLGVGNGLDAIVLALKALNIGHGDEVLVPSNTFIATWLAVSHVGAIPIPVEPELTTFNIDCTKIKYLISSKTKAIIPVHLYGNPVNISRVKQISNKYKLKVIYDAAQAHGAEYKSKRLGYYGDIATWSFYPGKNLGGIGDGGAITTNNLKIYNKIKKLRNYGSSKKYVHDLPGINSRLNSLQSIFLKKKLNYLDNWNNRRNQIADTYNQCLDKYELQQQSIDPLNKSCFHLYVIKYKYRNKLIEYLKKANIQCLIHYPIPPHKQKCYKSDRYLNNYDLELTDNISNSILSIPIGPHLNDAHISYIINNIKKYFDGKR
jgi:dTDP-4-amino-4,6-dideoxygalactose transaminase